MPGPLITNNAISTLASGITAPATAIPVAAGQGARFPSPAGGDWFYATLVSVTNQIEIVKCTARVGDTLTVVRAQDGTTALAFASGAKIELRPCAALFADLKAQAVTEAAAADAIRLPTGIISMWSGSVGSIPAGWQICDGTNGTPNLYDRFIVGAGSAYAVGSSGGVETVTLSLSQIPGHQHSGTTNAENAAHTHSGSTSTDGLHGHAIVVTAGNSTGPNAATSNGAQVSTAVTEPEGLHGHTFTTGNESAPHAHDYTTSFAGGGGAHENRPPYFALCYIMKL